MELQYREAAAAGHPEAMVNLGTLLRNRGDLAEAELWYWHAAHVGNVESMLRPWIPVIVATHGVLTLVGGGA
ncbi:hypothetical protein [Streptomyces aureus]|uniref:Sel1 repeat family protein n=1 Tax=Streptomyces aureus TaxID=193461 RepID=A0ABV4SW84_9ACTN